MKEKERLAFIKRYFPHFVIKEVKVNNRGWDNDLVIINNNLVFRFPKSEEVAAKVKTEGEILTAVKARNPLLVIPEFEYMHEDDKVKGVKYPLIEGKSLSEYAPNTITCHFENARLVGDFLTKLHSVEVAQLNSSMLTSLHNHSYWESFYKKVERQVFPFLKYKQQEQIAHLFERFLESYEDIPAKKVIIHGDLTTSNIIYNEQKGRISGIIDFTDAQIGDPAFDFAGIYWAYGPDFTKNVLSCYQSSEKTEAIFKRVSNFYGLQPVFHELLYALENQYNINWETALERFNCLYEFINAR
ncbi:aminoglycoside phosphotransferase family protein [Niallia sp. Sow4_A1]|uniref:Aminoglycoside phosphotransferase family protein n=1 Tax=Niallia hominis TaxID=3133173 RepID=A0ABV1F342_9BACI|nr:aminoglycoside phosphotransferase family protein [Niallia sp. MER TA 168]MCM3362184.1 aminoglycoside phosphotransferase family protein [Niallia sp. MER TA 168]